MLHTKFQGHQPFGSKEDLWRPYNIYGHGCHLGQVTETPGKDFRSPNRGRLHIKFGFSRASGFREGVWNDHGRQNLSDLEKKAEICLENTRRAMNVLRLMKRFLRFIVVWISSVFLASPKKDRKDSREEQNRGQVLPIYHDYHVHDLLWKIGFDRVWQGGRGLSQNA